MVELLSPAGDMEKLKTAFHYGADACYLGGKAFNLRAASSNFSLEDLEKAVIYSHELNKKVYITLNIIAHQREIKALPKFVQHLEKIGVDAVIVADLGVLDIVTEFTNLPVHISTQSSTTNARSVKVWQKLGAKRVVLARECTLDEIKMIKDQVPEMEIEVFVHGAMCMAYSGRCMISQYMTERDGNRGACANACRWKFAVSEEKRPGEFYPVYEDENGSHLYNSKDLCTIEFIDKILEAGVDGLKIEGRMKSIYYNATITRVYKEALELFKQDKYKYNPLWLEELKTVSNRQYTSGFFHGGLDRFSQNLSGEYTRTNEFVGVVKEKHPSGYTIEIRGRGIKPGDHLQILGQGSKTLDFIMPTMLNPIKDTEITIAHPSTLIKISSELDMLPNDIIRRKNAL